MATDPVIVVDARRASQSQIVSPQVLPYIWRTKFSTLIRDVATTATQDPVFSIQITNAYLAFHTTEGDKEMLSALFRQSQLASLPPRDNPSKTRSLPGITWSILAECAF